MTYFAQYARGKRYKIGRVGTIRPERAREEAAHILARAQLGDDPAGIKRKAKAHSLRTFVDDVYAPWAEVHVRSHKNTLGRLRANFPSLQPLKLGEISPWHIEKWREGRLRAGKKASTVNRDFDDLKSALGKAVSWGYLDTHPFPDVKRIRTDDAAKVRFLSDDEDKALFAALDARNERICQERDSANAWRKERNYEMLPDLRKFAFADHLKPLALLSLHTGIRRGEAFHLRWSDIDLNRGLLTVHGSSAKSAQTRHIPLNLVASETLSLWESCSADPRPDELVFPGKDGRPLTNVRRSWEGVLQAAKIHSFRWHDLRHTFASRLVMAGVDLNTVRELLGHSTIAMTLRYAHLAPEHTAAAVAKLVPPC